MSWTDERVALLKKLWGEGKTAAEIATTLGGVTRNAVIGKAHRLKLSNRTSPIQPAKKQKTPANTSTPPAAVAAPKKLRPAKAIDIPKGQGLSLMELKPNMCRWPSGDPRDEDFGFCGCASIVGLPYCEEHAKIAYQAARNNRVLRAEDFEEKTGRSSDDRDDIQKIAINH